MSIEAFMSADEERVAEVIANAYYGDTTSYKLCDKSRLVGWRNAARAILALLTPPPRAGDGL